MTHYAFSCDLRGKRRVRVLRMPDRVAMFLGRHLWRLGQRRWQIEKGRFATSHIPTNDKPVRREADSISYPFNPPMVIECRGILIEGTRTNYALWSAGKGPTP